MNFDPDVVKLFAAMGEANLPTIDQMTTEQARMFYQIQSDRVGGANVEMASVKTFEASGPAGAIRLRLYRPDGLAEHDAPALVFFHGGGWVIGDLDTHDKVCRQIAKRGACLVIAVDYRLAPEHPAPAAPLDALAAFRWIGDNAATLGADPKRLAVGGDSAGGNLAAVVALAARDSDLPLRAQILIYPAVDLRENAGAYPSKSQNAAVPPLTQAALDFFGERYVQDPSLASDWRLSPLAAKDRTGLAPALVITAEHDVLRDEGLAYADALEAAGVPVSRIAVPGMIHGFITMSGALSAADRVLDEIGTELRSRLAA